MNQSNSAFIWCPLKFSETLLWVTLTLTLIHPASNWTHWATLRRHPCLSIAATSVSYQVNPIFCRSLLTALLQFALVRPGPLLYPCTYPYSACCGMHWWSIQKTCPSQRSRLSLSKLFMVCCPVLVLTSALVICLSMRCPVYSSAICDVQHPDFSLMLLSMAIHQHRTGELTKLLLCIVLSSLSD